MTGNGPEKPDKKPPIVVRRKRRRPGGRTEEASLDALSAERGGARSKTPGLLEYTLIYLYKNLYILGITLLRRGLKYRRKLRLWLGRTRLRAVAFASRVRRGLERLWKGFVRRLKLPFVRLREVRRQMHPVIEDSRRDGKVPLRAYWRIVATFLRLLYTIIRTLVNYGAPIAAVIFLHYFVTTELSQPMGLLVEYNGETLGYVVNEAEFESATRILKDRYISDDADTLIAAPTFELVKLPEDEEYTPAAELANRIVEASGSEIEWGFGLYIDNTFYGAVTQSRTVLEELQAILDENSIGAEDEQVSFVKPLKFEPGLYPVDSIVEEEGLLDVIHSSETVDEYYIVQDGDSPLLVADKTGIPLATLEALNGDLTQKMVTGEEILTQVAQPFLSVLNRYTTVYREEIDYPVEEVPTELYGPSYRSIEQEGVPGVQEVTAEVAAVNGVPVSQTVLETRVVTVPVPQKVVIGTQTYVPPASTGGGTTTTTAPPGSGGSNPGGFLWPTDGGYMTSYAGHTGVDIARPYGTNIYASRSGTVILSRVTYVGYGRYIMIDHGDGFVTLYAHCSSLYVTVGDYVSQGQIIAAVGSTGNSTGNHLHFEVRLNGQIMNPRNYIG